ncbi:MAG: hypothetical protein H6993_06555 [Pseudomonadales bacterium]|nr:hypothetical protein [Pseudomonadales bacterium]
MRTGVYNRESDRTLVVVAYILHLIGAVAGVTSLIGLALNYFHDSSPHSLVENHHRWMIRSFWWAVVWMVVGWITSVILIGWVIMGLAWLWYLYRHVRGLLAVLSGDRLPS